jgi:hypothetical protein
VHYAARCRHGEPISTAFIESAVHEIVAKRMNKKQQMRWNRMTVQPFLDVRTAVLDGTLKMSSLIAIPAFVPQTMSTARRLFHRNEPHSFTCSPRISSGRVIARRGLAVSLPDSLARLRREDTPT